MSILDFLGMGRKGGPPPPAAQTETVRKIVRALDELDPERARYIAAFAYILSRVARADLKVSSEETAAMERLIMERGALPEEQAIMVVQMAKNQNLLFGGTENFLVTREFKRMAGRDEKLALLDCLFSVAAAGDTISVAEDNEIRQIGDELELEHRDFIAVRSRYRDRLSFLKRPEE